MRAQGNTAREGAGRKVILGEAEMCTGHWDLPQGTGSNPSCAAESPARPHPAMLAQVACVRPASVCFKETLGLGMASWVWTVGKG